MSITNKTWAIIGGAAALILVPAGVSYAVVSATDDRPSLSVDAPFRSGGSFLPPAARGDQEGGMRGGMNGDTYRFRDGSGERDRERDGSNCNDDGPVGAPPAGDTRGRGQGMMDGSGPRNS